MDLLAVPVGIAIGLSLGALGGGGSILTVPALVYLLGQNAHGATSASLVIVGVAAMVGMVVHQRKGRVRIADGLAFGGLGVVGSLVGSRLSTGVDPQLLLVLFSVLMFVGAFAMLRRSRGSASPIPSQHPLRQLASSTHGVSDTSAPMVASEKSASISWAKVFLAASVVGLVTGFFGVGGGFVVVPALVLSLGYAMPEAVGTSLLVIAVNSAAGLLARIGTHVEVDWAIVAIFAMSAAIGSVVGNRVATRARPEMLSLGFTVLLVAVAIYTMGRSLPHVI